MAMIMEINATTASDPSTRMPNQYAAMSSEEFVEIMFAELSNQDPLQPQDSNALLEQVQSLRAIESDMELQDTMSNLVETNEQNALLLSMLDLSLTQMTAQDLIVSAGSLIGREVIGFDSQGEYVQGRVTSVSFESETPILKLSDGSSLELGDVERINE